MVTVKIYEDISEKCNNRQLYITFDMSFIIVMIYRMQIKNRIEYNTITSSCLILCFVNGYETSDFVTNI